MLDLHNYWLNTSWVSNGGRETFTLSFLQAAALRPIKPWEALNKLPLARR
jgi:hypothetical protein